MVDRSTNHKEPLRPTERSTQGKDWDAKMRDLQECTEAFFAYLSRQIA